MRTGVGYRTKVTETHTIGQIVDRSEWFVEYPRDWHPHCPGKTTMLSLFQGARLRQQVAPVVFRRGPFPRVRLKMEALGLLARVSCRGAYRARRVR